MGGAWTEGTPCARRGTWQQDGGTSREVMGQGSDGPAGPLLTNGQNLFMQTAQIEQNKLYEKNPPPETFPLLPQGCPKPNGSALTRPQERSARGQQAEPAPPRPASPPEAKGSHVSLEGHARGKLQVSSSRKAGGARWLPAAAAAGEEGRCVHFGLCIRHLIVGDTCHFEPKM